MSIPRMNCKREASESLNQLEGQVSNQSDINMDLEDDWRFSTPEEIKTELEERFSEEEKAEVWSEAAETVKKYYEELLKRWKEEMDTLLVYAGLFSAILTAFNMQSYPLLQPDPTDYTLAVLLQISRQLDSFSVHGSFINSTENARSLAQSQTPFQPSSSAVWINTLWFSSLVLSLAAASIALIVKQWLQEVIVGLSGTSRDSARLRQYRLNGLLKWRVGTIVVALPILLQVALILFLTGMVILLWTLHHTVAAVTSSLVGTLFAAFVVVSMTPVFKWDCFYRSPQAFALYTMIRVGYNTSKRVLDRLFHMIWMIDIRFRGRLDTSSFFCRLSARIHHLADIPTWHGREQVTIASETGKLDRSIATTAYTTTLSPNYLERMHVILPDLPHDQLDVALQDIFNVCDNHWGGSLGPGSKHWFKNVQCAELSALSATRQMLTVPEQQRDDDWVQNTISVLKKLISTRAGDPLSSPEDFVSTLSPLSIGNNALAWTAGEEIASYWIFSEQVEKELASYTAVRGVLAYSSWRLKNWREEEYTFDNFESWVRAARCVALCLSRSISNYTISPAQLKLICENARAALLDLENLLLQQDWALLEPEKSEVIEGRRDLWPIVLPHRLSGWLVRWIIEPLTVVYESGDGRALDVIPHTLVDALWHAWSAVERAFPCPLDAQVIETIKVYTQLDSIVPAMLELDARIEKARMEERLRSV
ncbi:hypothetical protein C8Q74DRAFT_1296310 [Fomes fomentarius]|nr:hypothetical protein C8Q74DRAFT_1296310 [Fomes fomentarius]